MLFRPTLRRARCGDLSLFMLATCILLWCADAAPVRGQWRPIDGNGTNVDHPSWGAAGTALLRESAAAYPDDGSGTTIVEPPDYPNARDVSNAIFAQDASTPPNARGLSSGLWQWGQFVDHDIDLTGTSSSSGTAMIDVNDTGDVLYPMIPLERSNYMPGTGEGEGNPRQQMNEITSYLDASNVYGSDSVRATALRTMEGGLLKTSEGNLLPLNTPGLPNAGGTSGDLFLGGDVRANEQLGLTAMHTLFVREHNRLATLLAVQNDSLDDELLYQTTRRIVGAEIQRITYNEFLPALLGPGAPSPEDYDYDSSLTAAISNEFSTAFYRFGHSMLNADLWLGDNEGILTDTLPLRDAFFNPEYLKEDPNRVDQLLMGLSMQQAQEIDAKMVDDVRDFLFGEPGSGGMDLAALNIQRGRDHGLPDYNTLRLAYDLPAVEKFSDITSDPTLQEQLAEMYDNNVSNVDAWVGGLAEDHLPGSSVGPLVHASLVRQFTRLRDADPFFYEGDLLLQSSDVLAVIDLDSITLSKLIEMNTVMSSMRPSFMVVPEPQTILLLAMAAVSFFVSRFRGLA